MPCVDVQTEPKHFLAQVSESQPVVVAPSRIVEVPEVIPGGILHRAAEAMYGGDTGLLLGEMLIRPLQLTYEDRPGSFTKLKTIPPHTDQGNYGPRRSEVLVVGKQPTPDELSEWRQWSGEAGEMWRSVLTSRGVNFSEWCYVNACWYWTDPTVVKWKDAHWKECLPLLARTINIVRPKYMLLFGADALKAAWTLQGSGKAPGFKDTRGAVFSYAGNVQALAAINPRNVMMDPATKPEFFRDLRTFSDLVTGKSVTQKQRTVYEIDDAADLNRLVDRLIAEDQKRFAIDCEWGGGDYLTGKLRTVQVAWSDTEAVVVILRRAGMVDAFKPGPHAAYAALVRLLKRPGVGVIGHNVRGDLRYLMQVGVDLTEEFTVRGFDTMLAHHLCFESAEQQLELAALRLLGIPRWDQGVRKWLSDNKVDKDLIKEIGYGTIPDEILHPYAAMDAMACMALEPVIRREMDRWPGLKELYEKVVHPVHLPLHEMESTGLLIDEPLVEQLVNLCAERKVQLLEQLQKTLNWPDFNPRSPYDMRALLFGWKKEEADGTFTDIAPPGAVTFQMTPIKDTADMPWERVMELPENERRLHAPSTDAETVGILTAQCPLLRNLKRFKTVDQMAKNFLREKVADEETGAEEWDKGIGGWIGPDGRLRTRYRQTIETGRYATSPNLQNWGGKKTEDQVHDAFSSVFYVVRKSEAD